MLLNDNSLIYRVGGVNGWDGMEWNSTNHPLDFPNKIKVLPNKTESTFYKLDFLLIH
ncbi:hypothetical protein [Gottfriedia luciferensis]|uniref:hypothetical protein n=1 Tax=Gottfriedia luciferensis TaxID=178774 RepID=UPI00130258E1|nr:hypothetical protein [Gottfriedia luciferensis]